MNELNKCTGKTSPSNKCLGRPIVEQTRDGWWVRCPDCHKMTGLRASREMAVWEWNTTNRRTGSQEPKRLGMQVTESENACAKA